MKFLIALSFKNLARYTKRTIITASAIAFGLAMFLFIDSMLKGAEKDSERNLIWYETASARVYARENLDDWRKMNLKHMIENPGEIISAIEDAGYEAAPRAAFSGEMVVYRDPFPEDGSVQVRLFAVDPVKDPDVYRMKESLIDGSSWLEEGSNGVIMGSWMAEDLGADIGYPVTIVTRTRDGAFQTIDLEITGLIKTANPMVNRSSLLMDLSYADAMLNLDGAVSQIDVSYPLAADDREEVAALKAALPSQRDDVSVVSWRFLAGDYLSLAAAKQSGTLVILGLVFIIALVGISNTMLLAMYERRRELGMLRAMGMTDREIGLSFMMEAGGIGLIGSLIGAIIGAALVWFLVDVGINFEFILRDFDAGYRISSVFRGIWRPGMFVLAAVFGVVMSMIVALIPTRQALKMRITDCLHAET
ncbi:ABC transporter permease [Salinispira pacifica]|uniref:ABC transporter, permease protein n=1 Tax=Salinispira pacifica TaxID=1307761 RepID=V5WIE0_9SPIO|nr:FtsX-like permease family protein [Salinispira pacifica]AHC15582.1 ABC transporter, permease protein [Salinispira pacifica]